MKLLQRLRNLSLRYQVMLGIAAAFLILFVATSYVALSVTRQSTDAISEARLRLVVVVASSVDALVSRAAYQLQDAASSYFPAERPGSLRGEVEALYRERGLSETFEWLALVRFHDGAEAEVVSPLASLEPGLAQSEVVLGARQTGAIRIGELSLPAFDQPRLVFAVSVFSRGGNPDQVLVAGMSPGRLIDLLPQGEGLMARIIDADGVVVVDRLGGVIGERDEHMRLLRPLIEAGKPGMVIHKETADYGHLVAYASLRGLDGGVLLEEPQDAALSVPSRLRTSMLWLGIVALAVLVVSAALHSQMVIRPVIGLARATQNITRGVLDEPVPTSGLGEVEMLARNLEAMRLALKEAHEQRLGFERELEERVRERTRQVEKLMSQIISIQEEERRRLAQELHDDTAQTLATVLVNLQAAQQVPDKDKAQELVARALAQQAQVLIDIRRIISALRPAALDDLGLVSALRAYAEERLGVGGVGVQFDVVGGERPLSPAVETAVFRILQEAVNNIAKHAGARRASLHLEFGPDSLTATVNDDGRGFDVDKVLSHDKVGLQGMRERAAIIGARLKLESRTGQGTRAELYVPLPSMEVKGG
ncbi:MAG: histidine kinase [Dehalococcoidia bacterium]|nr:histidine kinase [Dehalococcoidia bacterium]